MSLKNTSAPFPQKLAYILICLIAIGFIAIVASEIVIPLVFALLISILLLPLVQRFEKKMNFSRGPASFCAILLFAGGITLIIYLVGSQISNLSNDWPLFQNQLHASIF